MRHGPRTESGGLVQQGWRDTTNPRGRDGGGILHADGSVPEPPLADADTQAVTVAALRATARLSGDSGWVELADRTAERIAHVFTPDTVAVDAHDGRVAGAGSQLGWLLWADALPVAERAAYADRLCRPDVLTDFGFGLRAALGRAHLMSRAPGWVRRSTRAPRGSVAAADRRAPAHRR